MSRALRFAALITIFLAWPANAILPSAPVGEVDAAPTADKTIEQSQNAGDDTRISDRISGIFAELPAFADIKVEASEGVVRLSGTVSDADARDRAENIAGRVAGVVAVVNEVERDLSIDENLSIFGKMSDLTGGFAAALPLLLLAIITALLIGAAGYLLANFGFLWDRITPNQFLSELIRSAIRFVFVVGGIVIALDMLGAGALLGAVLGGAGVLGIALGFAMRDTVENYVASLMLSLRQPFRANDHVLIDDREGRVIRLTSRATVLMTLDGNHLRIPNGQVFKAIIVNFTRNPQRRFEFELGIDADDDPRSAMSLGRRMLGDLNFVLADPEPTARITQVGDSNIVIAFLGWVDQRKADWAKSRSLAIASVKDALEEAGFALPEPIYRLRFDGRTDPLPIGRSNSAVEIKPSAKVRPKPERLEDQDVRPENEISAMVDKERQSGGDRNKDLLDPDRPQE